MAADWSDAEIAHVAESIAEFFSRDAARWKDYLPPDVAEPFSVRFWWFGMETPPLGRRVLAAIEAAIGSGYRSEEEWAATIVWGGDDAAAATVTFAEQRFHDGDGIAYEIRIRRHDDHWPGWFGLDGSTHVRPPGPESA